MNRFITIVVLLIVITIFAIAIGAEVVQVLRDAAAPPALPYGLAMRGG
jgi:hypothetical protein